MNWDRELKRITLILSIVDAVIAAGFSLDDTVRWNLNKLLIATIFGAGFGFCAVWELYAATKWGAWPLYKWISVGFREDKQKDLKKNE